VSSPSQVLFYANPNIRRPLNWKRICLVILSLVLLAYAYIVAKGTWHETTISICTQCGLHQHHSDYYIPLTSICYHRSSAQRQTPVSTVLAKHSIRTNHQHQFVTAFGNSGPRLMFCCTLYHARHIDPFNTAPFLDNVIQYSDAATALKWIDIILDPHRSPTTDRAAFHVPPAGFADQSAFDAWWLQQKPLLDAISNP
jgi:hypothetical protein